jgi:tRNA 2-thiouridine synthesizing protein A
VIDLVIDERGRLCPLPVIALGRAAHDLPPGSVIELLADDPAAAYDVPAWCQLRGHDLLAADLDRYLVRLRAPDPT